MLLFAFGIGKTEIYKLDFVIFDHLHDISDGFRHRFLL